MRYSIFFLVLFICPYLLMIAINETIRPNLATQSGKMNGHATMNPTIASKHKCTWQCHNATNYCKANHVKVLKPYYNYTDPIYFGIINLLHSTGNYGLANIVFLVILIPFLICYFITKSWQYNLKRKILINKN
jgi:uncharacterized membrane protein YtjA (UPF0391 family)